VPITASRDGAVVTLTLDDGKVNAMGRAFFADLSDALDALDPPDAVVLAGRPGIFSAGLDREALATLDDDGLADLLVRFGRTLLRVWLEPRPVVAAATGHAVAGGTLLALAADHAVAARGTFTWGLVETTIGFPLPRWAIALARANVASERLEDLLLPGMAVGPEEAVAAGFADALAEPGAVVLAAQRRAGDLVALPRAAYAETKRRLRAPAALAALERLEDDTRELLAARS
jgi:enoyl-CoA hydratase